MKFTLPTPKPNAIAFKAVAVGDLVLIHGHVAVVIEKFGPDGGFIYRTEAGEELAYNHRWPISEEPRFIWILEQ